MVLFKVALDQVRFMNASTIRTLSNEADVNGARLPELGQEKQLSFEKSDGGTKSKVGRLISQFQEFAKVSSK